MNDLLGAFLLETEKQPGVGGWGYRVEKTQTLEIKFPPSRGDKQDFIMHNNMHVNKLLFASTNIVLSRQHKKPNHFAHFVLTT